MIDHVALTVRDYRKSRAFYEKALGPLGYSVLMEFDGDVSGLGADGKPDLWIAKGEPLSKAPVHIAFASGDRKKVDAFYKEALSAGGQDNGAPGLRPHYHANYYGAFVIDPDGNNIEVVCHEAV